MVRPTDTKPMTWTLDPGNLKEPNGTPRPGANLPADPVPGVNSSMHLSSPLHCDDVTRELAAPAPGFDRLALAAHLAACPACASWADQDAALTRIWDATRPVEPSDAAWDTLWAQVNARRDDARTAVAVVEPAIFPGLPRPRKRLASGLFMAAQAAAILAAAVLLWPSRSVPVGRVADVLAQAPVLPLGFEIDQGEPILIREGPQGLRAVVLAQDDRLNKIDDNYELFNYFESMAE
ncbi:MAG: hypothetical protein NVSMB9_14700 [Isosphaeraceae bacterium]